MATVDKAFRVKNGLIVEGSSATVNGSNVLTEASTEFLQDTTAAMFDGSQSGIAFEYNDTTGKITATVSTDPLFGDKITFEGTTPDAYELVLQVTDPTQDVTVTLPNATDTLVGKATTDTFTNKTFDTAGIGNSLQINSNAISSYSGTGNTVVLTNTPTITSLYVNTGLNLNGATTGHTELLASTVASGTITFPAVTGTVITTGDTGSVTSGVLASNSVTNAKIADDAVDTAEIKDGAVTNAKLAGSIANDKLSNSAITINGTSTSLGGSRTLVTDDIAEDGSPTNLWFTDERAQDAVATAIANGTQTNITITYSDENNSLSFNASGGVSSIAGTANQITASSSTGAVTLSLPSAVTFPGTVTLNADPANPLEAATKQYVDEVAEGLKVKPAVQIATTSNLSATYSNGSSGVGATLTGTSNGAFPTIDGVTLTSTTPGSNGVLVKNQSNPAENGRYNLTTLGDSGAPWVLTRCSLCDQSSEIPGMYVFVKDGTLGEGTGWVAIVSNPATFVIGTDAINFTQFSGAGTYTAGNGLTLTGTSFSINTAVTVDINTAQTLTNKTLTSPVLTTPSISGMLILDNNIVIEGTDDTHETTLTFTDPTQDNTITFKNATGTVAFTADIESAVDGFGNAVTGSTGITASYASTSNILTITNVGVTSLAGTTDQISVSASTGSVTLSLPQSIASTSSPTFAGLSVGSGSLTAGSVTLTDALIGTATTSVTTTSATVIDTWSAATYSTAKYVVQMKNGNDVEVLEVLVTIDGNNNVYLTEYADVISNTQIGTTDADFSGGNVRLLVTSVDGTTVKVHKTLIEA
jgi:hypothetical protein